MRRRDGNAPYRTRNVMIMSERRPNKVMVVGEVIRTGRVGSVIGDSDSVIRSV